MQFSHIAVVTSKALKQSMSIKFDRFMTYYVICKWYDFSNKSNFKGDKMVLILSNPIFQEAIKRLATIIVMEAAKAIIKGLNSDDKSSKADTRV